MEPLARILLRAGLLPLALSWVVVCASITDPELVQLPSRSRPVESAADTVNGGTRTEEFARLARQVAGHPGWTLHDTAHYFVLANFDDEEFLTELLFRLEAARERVREDFPHPELDPVPVAEAPSVVRVFAGRASALAYGLPSGSAGTWSPSDREIVLYDDKAGGGRGTTWAVLNGMVSHEYLRVTFGPPAPPMWFADGHADYYSGLKLKRGTVVLRPFSWRIRVVQGMIREERFVPLRRFVELTPLEFLSGAPYDMDRGDMQAQAWSFIWFLRNSRNECSSWDSDWDGILDTWWGTWLETRDAPAANARAFADVDWAEVEAAWKVCITKGI